MADKREALRALITKATDVTEADLMRYEHGGGRWAKLRDGERTLVADFYNEADREAHVAAWLALPGLLKAADEITRLNAENERLKVDQRVCDAECDACLALVDEMREGLETFTRVSNDEERREAFNQAVALIAKASRDSGHG